eukprot:gene9524-1730_t
MGIPDSLFVTPVSEFFQCGICSEIFKDCYQTPCSHRYCFECLEKICKTQKGRCAYDRKIIKLEECHPDKTTNEYISQLLVKCPKNKKHHEECDWKGQYSDLTTHLKSSFMNEEITPKFNDRYLNLLETSTKNELVLQLQKKCETQELEIQKLKNKDNSKSSILMYQNDIYKKNKKKESECSITYSWSEISQSSKYMEIVQSEFRHVGYESSRKTLMEALVKLPAPYGKDVAELILMHSNENNIIDYSKFCTEMKQILNQHFICEFEIHLKNSLDNLVSISLENEERKFEFGYIFGPLLREHVISNTFANEMIQKILVYGTFEDLNFRSEMLLDIMNSCGSLLYESQKKYFYCIVEGLSIQSTNQTKENLKEILRIIQTEKVQKRIKYE